MELQRILPDLIKEVVKQTLESIMVAEREVFIKEHGGTKNGFYVRNGTCQEKCVPTHQRTSPQTGYRGNA